MEKIKQKIYGMSLKNSLILIFIIFLTCIGILSVITIFLSSNIQRYVLDSRTLSFEIENSDISWSGGQIYRIGNKYKWSGLTLKQKILYYGSIIGMMVLIVMYILTGGLLAGLFYYRIKLREPLEILKKGFDNITKGNLDFSFVYKCDDELGLLCGAFEKMLQELIKNKKQVWMLLDERCAINASIIHDLGTPITVIKGYLEYLKKSIPKKLVTTDSLIKILENMYEATGRLEKYIECVRDVQKIDEIEILSKRENLIGLLTEMESDFKKLAEKYGKKLYFFNLCNEMIVEIDKIQFFRVMENIVTNAFRYALYSVVVEIKQKDNILVVSVEDDGNGFSKEEIESAIKLFYTTSKNGKNMGFGLYISKILCEKQGGKLYIGNKEKGGGRVVINFKI